MMFCCGRQLLRDNLTLWTSDAGQESSDKKPEGEAAPAAAAPAAEAPAEGEKASS